MTESRSANQNPALDLVVKERRKLLNFVRASVHELSDAEEIVQKASVKAACRAKTLRDPAKAEAWIYRVLRNEIADHFRRAAVQSKRAQELPQEVTSNFPPDRMPPRTCPCAMDELAKLRDNYSEALRAIEMGEEPVASYAARRGISANNAMVSLHRARKSLRQRLEQRCAKCAGAGCFDCTCES